MNLTSREYEALLRNDFISFATAAFQQVVPSVYQHNWHHELIASYLIEMLNGNKKRLIINLPPRSLKSFLISVALPAWILGRNPEAQIICVSYSNELAEKHARDCKALMGTGFYKRLFPNTYLSKDKNSANEFATTKGGFRLCTSPSGTLTGRGADFIIIDDPIKSEDAYSETTRNSVNGWFDNTLFSRLNSKENGKIIVVMQRLHEDDLTGYLTEKGGWEVLSLPAEFEEDAEFEIKDIFGSRKVSIKAGYILHSQRESKETLAEIRKTMGSYSYSSQYQQKPMPAGGGMIKREWFKTYGKLPMGNPEIVLSLDTACKTGELNDYSVCMVFHKYKEEYYLVYVWRKKVDYPDLKKNLKSLVNTYNPSAILVEDRASGTQLIQDIRKEIKQSVIAINPESDKISRMSIQSAKIEAGKVYIPEDAAWMSDFMHEILHFPNGKHDDQIDALSQYLGWQSGRLHSLFVLSIGGGEQPHYGLSRPFKPIRTYLDY